VGANVFREAIVTKVRAAAIVLVVLSGVVLTSASCYRSGLKLTGSRSVSFGNAARLDTQFHKDPSAQHDLPLFHVLFVPQWEVSRVAGYGTTGSAGGTSDRIEFDYFYQEFGGGSRNRSVRSQPIRVLNGKTLQAAGRSFDLSAGSVFVADVALDGAVRITQLPRASQPQDSSPVTVLAFIKSSLPAHSRVQRLQAAP
jgi:hypothetical protein